MNLRDPALAAIVERAADWLGRHDAGLSPAEQAKLEQWLLADPRHQAAFTELERYSRALDRLSTLRIHDVATPGPATAAGSSTQRQPARTWAWSIAAAAMLAVGAIGTWQTLRDRNFSNTILTAVGEARRFALPDGSSLLLNTDSRVVVAYSTTGRAVELMRGEAHFTVAKNPRRPFVVRVGEVDVRALGTAFNVRRRDDSVDVLVTEGRVDIQDARAGQSLLTSRPEREQPGVIAGERVLVVAAHEYPAAPRPVAVHYEAISAVDVARRLAWQDRRLEFDPTPLEQIVAEFNRHSTTHLVVADPAIAQLSVGGSFRTDDVDTLLRLLDSSFDIAAEPRGQEILLRRKTMPTLVRPAVSTP